MLALASALSSLETDPQALGKRYQLTATCRPRPRPACAAIPGVQAVGAALRGGGRRLVLARRDDRRDRVSRQPHGVRGAAAGVGRGCAATTRRRSGSGWPRPSGCRRGRRSRSSWRRGASCGCGSPAWSARSITTVASPTCRRPRCSPRTRRRLDEQLAVVLQPGANAGRGERRASDRRPRPPPARSAAACRSSPCSARSCARSRSSTASSACTR